MQTKLLAVLFSLAAFGAAQDVDVDLDDFPRACENACRDITRLADDCDARFNRDSEERDCVCNGQNAQQLANSCAACVKLELQNDDDDDDDEDEIRELFRACNWNYDDVSATSSSSSQTSTNDSSSSTSTSSVITTTTETVPATTTTHTSDGTTSTETIPATTVTSTEPASPTNTDDGSAGSSVTIGIGAIAAGLLAALPVVL